MGPAPFDRDSGLQLMGSHFMERSRKDFPSHVDINFFSPPLTEGSDGNVL